MRDHVAEMMAAGSSAHPRVRLDPREARAFLAAKLDDGAEPAALSAPDLYLACACATGDAEALRTLDATILARIGDWLARSEKSAAVIDEVRQRVRERLLVANPGAPPKIATYAGRGTLASFVRVVATRIHRDLVASTRPATDSDAELGDASVLTPELLVLRERYGPMLRRALRESLGELRPRDRALFRHHYVDGLSMERIAALYDVDKSTISRQLSAARERLLDGAVERVREETGADEREARSLLALARSQIDVSLQGLLAG